MLGATRNLLFNLVRRDLTVRYKSTVLGFFWSFIKPLVLTAIFYVAFQIILTVPRESDVPFALKLLTGILAWTFTAGATGEAMNVIMANANLIKKVRLPLAVFPLAAVCSHLIHFILALFVLVALAIVFHLPPAPAIVFFPLIMALQFLLTLAVALTLAALNVFYRDVGSLWEVLTTAWFYATPIVYPFSLFINAMEPKGLGWIKWLYLANPMTPIVLGYQRVLLYAAAGKDLPKLPDAQLLGALGLSLCVTLALFALSCKVFSRYSKSFADEL